MRLPLKPGALGGNSIRTRRKARKSVVPVIVGLRVAAYAGVGFCKRDVRVGNGSAGRVRNSPDHARRDSLRLNECGRQTQSQK
jgi:hypothetical protein